MCISADFNGISAQRDEGFRAIPGCSYEKTRVRKLYKSVLNFSEKYFSANRSSSESCETYFRQIKSGCLRIKDEYQKVLEAAHTEPAPVATTIATSGLSVELEKPVASPAPVIPPVEHQPQIPTFISVKYQDFFLELSAEKIACR
jgi:hypothetical protein